MKKQKVYLASPLYQPTQKELENTYDVYHLEEAAALINSAVCEVIVSSSGYRIDAATLAKFPTVKLVANFGTGVDLIDLNYCLEHDIAVSHTPGVLTEDVADLALTLILTTLRKVVAADRFARKERWLKQQFGLTRSVRGLNVGIIGMGEIGREVARLCTAFGTEIGYFGPHRKPVDYTYFPELKGLAGWADVLVVACPGGESTQGLVSASILDELGPQGILINIARGSVVDELALVERLVSGTIAGAGLDVFADEPHIPEQLRTLDNVVLQPHLGSATDRTRRKMGNLTLDNVAAYFEGRPLITPFNLKHPL
ncbi:MAG: 2-hydroxyacid dehydrogenase [Desulforhopalus sp.]